MDFADLYAKYVQDVHRLALFLSGNEAVADDLTAETFARALPGRDHLHLETVKPYLHAIGAAGSSVVSTKPAARTRSSG